MGPTRLKQCAHTPYTPHVCIGRSALCWTCVPQLRVRSCRGRRVWLTHRLLCGGACATASQSLCVLNMCICRCIRMCKSPAAGRGRVRQSAGGAPQCEDTQAWPMPLAWCGAVSSTTVVCNGSHSTESRGNWGGGSWCCHQPYVPACTTGPPERLAVSHGG
jgi:hypothetical protein